ncbi:HTH-type transcriptional regulator NimR [Vibrio stylophorae]|uniref:HTH-type transcriptional regulator NimR n=1 Tax=Vibrio stylophorae TaxID=659351 RepID=A0ABN8DR65_9VIBR|nr:helix-turn-helix transcriptional regulator [Vibrio stylophorae]CAH0533240.1 HTH-type transcriptional regulator NimR [Vibrio stylophorae]
MHSAPLDAGFEHATQSQPVTALRFNPQLKAMETARHQHLKGQLVLPLSGSVTCTIDRAIWMVPTNSAVWIPSQVPHSNHIASGADICMLFVEPQLCMPSTQSCTLSVSPLMREAVIRLAQSAPQYEVESATARLASVVLDELMLLPRERFDFPLPTEPRLQLIAQAMLRDPSNRQPMCAWAKHYAMSERTLARLVKQELGTTFGQWRGQLHIVIALQQLSAKVPVQRIAEHLGYESVSAFIGFFKKTLGMPPKQYIQQHRHSAN